MLKVGKQVKFSITTSPEMKQALDEESIKAGQNVVEIIRRAIAAELAKRGVVISDIKAGAAKR